SARPHLSESPVTSTRAPASSVSAMVRLPSASSDRVRDRLDLQVLLEPGHAGVAWPAEHGRSAAGPGRARLLDCNLISVSDGLEADRAAHRRTARAGNAAARPVRPDRKSTRLNSSHVEISYAVFCLKKKKNNKYAWSSAKITVHRTST